MVYIVAGFVASVLTIMTYLDRPTLPPTPAIERPLVPRAEPRPPRSALPRSCREPNGQYNPRIAPCY